MRTMGDTLGREARGNQEAATGTFREHASAVLGGFAAVVSGGAVADPDSSGLAMDAGNGLVYRNSFRMMSFAFASASGNVEIIGGHNRL